MITTIRITNTEEAKTAIAMIEAYLSAHGNDGVKTTPVAEPEAEEKKPTTKKKAPAKKPEPEAEEKPAPKKKAPAKKPEPETEEEGVAELDVATLTQLAKDAVKRTGDRDAVKDVVTKYSAKISTVDEADYQALADDLKAL